MAFITTCTHYVSPAYQIKINDQYNGPAQSNLLHLGQILGSVVFGGVQNSFTMNQLCSGGVQNSVNMTQLCSGGVQNSVNMKIGLLILISNITTLIVLTTAYS